MATLTLFATIFRSYSLVGILFLLLASNPGFTNAKQVSVTREDDLAASLQTHILKFFRSACNAECCGQISTSINGSLPCCPSCSDLIRGDALGLPFGLTTCLCVDGSASPSCCASIDSIQTVSNTGMNDSRVPDSVNAPSNDPEGIKACLCPSGSLSPDCCSSKSPLSGNEGHGCSCGEGNGFSSKCCLSNSPQSFLGEDGEPKIKACLCPNGSLSPNCCSDSALLVSNHANEGSIQSGRASFKTSGDPVLPGLNSCPCGEGRGSGPACCGIKSCLCESGSLSPDCCRVAIMSAKLLSALRCPCADETTSESCCMSSSEFDVICACEDGSLSKKCCDQKQLQQHSASDPVDRVSEGGLSLKVQLKDDGGSPGEIPGCQCPDGSVTTKCPCGSGSNNGHPSLKSEL